MLKYQTKKIVLLSMLTACSLMIASESSWGVKEYSFQAHPSNIRSVIFVNNALLASSNISGGIATHNLDLKRKTTIRESFSNYSNTMLQSDGEKLFTYDYTEDNKIYLYNIANSNLIRTIKVPKYCEMLLDTHTSNKIFVATNQIITKQDIHTNAIEYQYATIDGCDLSTILKQNKPSHTLGAVKKYSEKNGIYLLDDRNLKQVAFHQSKVYNIFFIPHAGLILADGITYLELLDQRTWKSIKKIDLKAKRVRKVAIDPLEHYIALVIEDYNLKKTTLQLADAKTLNLLYEYPYDNIGSDCPTLVFSPDGKTLALGTGTGEIRIFDVEQMIP